MIREVVRHIVSVTYKPVLQKYLSKRRIYHYDDLSIQVPAGVFHPGFFFSTSILAKHILSLDLKKKTFLELGCGTAMLSLLAAKKGAEVTASDISSAAIASAEENSRLNRLKITICQSNLFDQVQAQKFDVIAINPPYYKHNPRSDSEYAWFCGENGEYYKKLFSSLSDFIHHSSHVVIILCDGCDMKMINDFANEHGLALKCIKSSSNLIENNFLFTIEKVTND